MQTSFKVVSIVIGFVLSGMLIVKLALRFTRVLPGIERMDCITIRRLNRHFKYLGIVSARTAEALSRDPVNLILKGNVQDLVQAFRYLFIKDLQYIAGLHRVPVQHATVDELRSRICGHRCSPAICPGYHIFHLKEIPRPRGNIEARFVKQALFHRDLRVPGAVLSSQESVQQPENMCQNEPELSHLEPPTCADIKSIIRNWEDEMSPHRFFRKPCAVCSKLSFSSDLEIVDPTQIDLEILVNPYLPPEVLPTEYNLTAYKGAILCPGGLEFTDRLGKMSVCTPCFKDLKKNLMPKLALANWLYYGRGALPLDVQQVMLESTIFERAMIARVRANGVCFRFIEHDEHNKTKTADGSTKKRSRHVRGNVMMAPLDVLQMHDCLPPSRREIADTLCIVFVSKVMPTRTTIKNFSPVLVRKSRVKLLLDFLIAHNPHYRRVPGFMGYSPERLNSLFDGSDDLGLLKAVHFGFLPFNEGIDAAMSSYVSGLHSVEDEDEEEFLMENTTYTSGDHTAVAYDAMRVDAVQRCLSGKPFLTSKAGSQPVPDFGNPYLLSWMFPHLDPWGIGGFYHPLRTRYVSMEEQLAHLLQVEDPVWENDPEFAFVFYNVVRKKMVSTSVRFRAPMASYSKVVKDIMEIDRRALDALMAKYRAMPWYIPATPEEKRILKVASSITPVARHVPGTTAQKIMCRNELRGLINYHGPPTLFVTLNPSDIHNPIVRVLAGRCSTPESVDEILQRHSGNRFAIAASHPVACVQFFDAMIRQFVNIVLKCGKGAPGIYGICDYYYGTVEAQGRGSLHCHMLVWLRGHPSPRRLKELLCSDPDYRVAFVKWVESIMCSDFLCERTRRLLRSLPDVDAIKAVLGEPHPGSLVGLNSRDYTPEAFKEEMASTTDELLLRYNLHRHKATCWKYLGPKEARTDSNCRFGMDGIVREKTEIDEETGRITVKRLNTLMTHYTPLVTYLMKCNHDVKFIGSGKDAKAFMYYVTEYITKPSLTISAGLSALSYSIRQMDARMLRKTGLSKSDTMSAMIIAVNSMLGHQETSHQQVMRNILIGGPERYTNVSFQAINWGECVRFVETVHSFQDKGEAVPADPAADHSVNESTASSVSVTLGTDDLVVSNARLDYIYRPKSTPVDEMGLYLFVSCTRKERMKRDDEGNRVLGGNRLQFCSSRHPQYNSHVVVTRTHPIIPVLLGPNLAKANVGDEQDEKWCRDMLILFKPWRNPLDLKDRGESWVTAYSRLKPTLGEGERRLMENMAQLAEGRDLGPRHKQPNSDSGTKYRSVQTAVEEEASVFEDPSFYEMNAFQEVDRNGLYDHEQSEFGGRRFTLEDLLGDDTLKAFDHCYPKNIEYLPGQRESNTMDYEMESVRALTIDLQRRMEEHARVLSNSTSNLSTNFSGEEDDDDDTDIWEGTPVLPGVGVTTIDELSDRPFQIRELDPQDGRRPIVTDIVAEMSLKDNPEQLRAFQIVSHHVLAGGAQLLMYVGGTGGTGKSHLIKAIVRLFQDLGRREELLIGAPTGIAATLIGGSTLHSLVMVGSASKGRVNPRLEETWRGVKYLIVDEVSMVGAQFMSVLSTRMKIAKGNDPRQASQNFGGVNVIFMGDFCQLPPPKQKSLFSYQLVREPSFVESRNTRGVETMIGAYLWRQVSTVVILKKNQRQASDPIFASVLDHIREGKCRDNLGREVRINDKTILIYLRERELSRVAATNPKSLSAFYDAPVVVGNKTLRDALNARLVRYHAERKCQRVHLYYSVDSNRSLTFSSEDRITLWDLPARKTQESLGRLPLFVGMKVMVTENISVPHRIVNGAEGEVVDVIYTTEKLDNAELRIASIVYVRIEGSQLKLPDLHPDVVPIFPRPVAIQLPLRLGQRHIRSFRRRQIPLVPAYSYTDYKSQGRSVDRVIVDLESARGQGVYVMLSRVRTLTGLLILTWTPATRILQRISGELRSELERLNDLDNLTARESLLLN